MDHADPPAHSAQTLEDSERDSAELLRKEHFEHLAFLSHVYNAVVRLNSYVHERDLRDLDDRFTVALLLLGRLANDLRSIVLLGQLGYGAQACALAATVFELGWQITWVAREKEQAERWMKSEHLTEGAVDHWKALNEYLRAHQHPTREAQLVLERRVYGKLCAMKHGSPLTVSFRPLEAWEREGSLRLGPDLSEFGRKSLCFAVEIAGQVALAAIDETAKHHLDQDQQADFIPIVDTLTAQLKALMDASKGRWSSFP